MISLPGNISQASSHTNFEYFQMMEQSQRKENISQLSEKSKRFILAKNIKKYENEQKVKQNTESLNTSQQNSNDKQFLQIDNKLDKANNMQTLKLTGFSNKNKEYVQPPKFLSPADFIKKQGSPSNQLELRKNLSSNSLQQPKIEKFEQKLQSISENVEPLKESKSTTFQTRKYLGPNFLTNEDNLKEKNIFLEKNNPINHSLYKEFNVGPRVDKEVGSPQWYSKQKDIQEKQLNKDRRSSQLQRYSIRGEDDDRYKPKNKSIYTNENTSTLKKQMSFATEKSFMVRPDTTQSAMKQQLQSTKKKNQRRNESLVEVSKDDLIRELRDIEKRHEYSMQKEQDIINNMRFDERNIFTREERVLKNHQKHLSDWDSQIKYSTEQSSRQPIDSCMLRGEQHRRKVEYAQAFDNLKTEDERFGKRQYFK